MSLRHRDVKEASCATEVSKCHTGVVLSHRHECCGWSFFFASSIFSSSPHCRRPVLEGPARMRRGKASVIRTW
eukprot:1136764-Pelagomonas_calceolata.AAC.13